MLFELAHIDTCLSDYFGGHHLPHIQVEARRGMTAAQLRDALRIEIEQGAIGGDVPYEVTESELFHYLALQAIDALEVLTDPLFMDLPLVEDEDDESVYAFFALVPLNNAGKTL